ncbi:site-specific integrase [Streptomyces sp. NPDC048277]|uniref:site-specific integrase n=1 Tax=Streptomyces sp. NPDC048277 TaxID=3155027 RepID=UPI0033F14031
MPAVVRLPAGKALTVRTAADVFLDSLGNANTLRSYATGVGKTAERLGEARPLATVADDEIGGALEQLWGEAAVNTWNARRASVLSWLGWCAERGYDGPAVPAWVKRMPPPDSETPARSKMAVDRLIGRRDVHLREKTLWRMLYETVARSEEILGVNIEELDLAGRRAPVKAKGAQPRTRHRGAPREEFVLETVYWDAGTARLLPRLIKGRTRGPVFVTHRRPGPGKVVSPRDVCPDTGLEEANARLKAAEAERQELTDFYAHVINELSTELDRVTAERNELLGNVRHIGSAVSRRDPG